MLPSSIKTYEFHENYQKLRLLFFTNLQFGSCYNHPLRDEVTTHDLPLVDLLLLLHLLREFLVSLLAWNNWCMCFTWDHDLLQRKMDLEQVYNSCKCFEYAYMYIIYFHLCPFLFFHYHFFSELPLKSGCTYFVTTQKHTMSGSLNYSPMKWKPWIGLELVSSTF